MTMLVNWQIKERIENSDLKITPYKEENVMPASYNLSIGNSFLCNGRKNTNTEIDWIIPNEKVRIRPYQFVLATTEETITLPDNIVGQVSGRSSYARKGIFIHTCAGFVDPGFTGEITLELYNCSDYPIEIKIGEAIAQISFMQTETANPSYREIGHYNGQKGATESYLLSKDIQK